MCLYNYRTETMKGLLKVLSAVVIVAMLSATEGT